MKLGAVLLIVALALMALYLMACAPPEESSGAAKPIEASAGASDATASPSTTLGECRTVKICEID